MLQKT